MQAGTSNPANPAADKRSRWDAWYYRVPLKLAIFTAVTLFVLFPYPMKLRRHLQHVMNMQAMVQPDAPELAAWDEDLQALKKRAIQPTTQEAEEIDAAIRSGKHDTHYIQKNEPRLIQKAVERFVYDR